MVPSQSPSTAPATARALSAVPALRARLARTPPKIDTPAREGLMIDTPAPDGTIKRQPFRYRKVDERTVEFRLPCRYAPAINTFIFPIAPRHKLEAAYRTGKASAITLIIRDSPGAGIE